MNTTWILAADGTRARIFAMEGTEVQEVEDLSNPRGRDAERDINTDKQGNWNGGGRQQGASHSYEPDVTPLKHEEEKFAKAIGDFLDKASLEKRFDKLCVIAPPEFMGRLRDKMGEQAKKCIKEELVKDISWFSDAAVEQYVKQHLH
jgi:protein required for attachment to host cells